MGFTIGLVSIEYLKEPEPPVLDFFKDLAMNPSLGLDEDSWGGGWEENTFLEFNQTALRKRAQDWCAETGISADGQATLMSWLSELPWQDDCLMLHLAT